MPTYLYCLTRDDADPPSALRGIDGAPVRVVDERGVRAWVSDVGTPPAVTAERARAHDAVIREALRISTPLPARFGQVLADDASMRQELVQRVARIASELQRVRGMVEMTVRVALGESSVSKSLSIKDLSGREYLERLSEQQQNDLRRRQRAEFLQRRVADAVANVVREEVVSTASGSGESAMLVISHLVAREHVTRYRDAVREVVRAIGEEEASTDQAPLAIPLMISGPWAPYSFVELRRD
ncbi:MAG TPA: GvpL/GvpF family gas vesicle protein [Gemmatimonadaceae bacterium]|nr:GvpL/GvpF family gas vesicle protein [Gemmatimonadaceae bacterium]